MSVRVFSGVACAFLLGSFPLIAEGQTAADAITQEIRNVFERTSEAVVRIEGRDARGKLMGTGFFIDPNGTLYTSYTIGGEADEVEVLFRDKRYPAKRLTADPRSGIALLKIDAETPFLVTGKLSELSVASPVMVVGYPMDYGASPSFGLISGFDMRYKGRYFSTTHIRASIAVQGGQGGAPMLNLKGEAVGVVISSAVGGGSCFALPIEAAEKVRTDFVRFGEPRPGYLGAELPPAGENQGQTQPQIMRLDESGPAALAGLSVGDVIVELAGRPVSAAEDVMNAAFYISAGDEVPVTVMRNGQRLSLVVKAAERPSKAPRIAINPPETPALLRAPAMVGNEKQQPSLGGNGAPPASEGELRINP